MSIRKSTLAFAFCTVFGFALGAGALPRAETRTVAATPAAAFQTNNSYTQQALAADSHFHKRLTAALAAVAWQVIAEAENTPNHEQRKNYARTTVLPNLSGVAVQIAPWIVMRPNVLNFSTSYDFALGAVVTTSGDADLQSQLLTDWNVLAGI